MPESILTEAARIIDGERTVDYGDPKGNFAAIAEVWTWYLDNRTDPESPLNAVDCAHMMILMKIVRATTGSGKRDTYVDIAGYAALAGRVGGLEGADYRHHGVESP